MSYLTKEIKNIDPSMYNSLRAKVAQSNRKDRRIANVTEPTVEKALLKVLKEFAKSKK